MTRIAALYADQALRLANERMNSLHREAEIGRMAAATPRRSVFQRLTEAVASLRSVTSSTEPEFGPALPKLLDYPYRG